MRAVKFLLSLFLAAGLGFFYCGDSEHKENEPVEESGSTTNAQTETEKPGPVMDEPIEAPGEVVAVNSGIDVEATLKECTPCHYLDKGADKKKAGQGPGLLGVYNRVPTIFKDDEMTVQNWNAAALEKWLTKPTSIKPRTRMGFSVPDPDKRAQIIEALKLLK